MKIVLIGAGNVATVLGRRIIQAGHSVLQVYSRQAATASSLAHELCCGYITQLHHLDTNADIYIIALPDTVLPDVARAIHLQGRLVVHTAGAVSKSILQHVSDTYGVLYPLQSLRKENRNNSIEIPLLLDANRDDAMAKLMLLAASLSGTIGRADDEERQKLHLGAVFVNNFTNYLYGLAQDYCKQENIDFNMLLPLIEETALRLRTYPAAAMQTGPAIRKDEGTIQHHLQMLQAYPKWQQLYRLLTAAITEP
ncbi:MAG TPA: F420-dependent NADP oxidoreductase [Ferruginibacter sp.]|nr:F420-dependent NADP oxidoreductase [Ferruginibacter sp.]HMP21894.1 F420-dependent NADP oxidoreductase [Ferruginibacter sp.]